MELGEICDLIVDCEHKTAPTQETGYPSIRTPNIGRGFLILDNVKRVSEETYRLWARRAIPKQGDLIMAREAPVGNVAIIPPGLNPCLGQRTLLIRCNKAKAEPAYLSYLLNGPQVQGIIYGMTNGVTVPHLNMKDVRTLPIPEIPLLPTQRKIASILSAYDDLIENNLRRIKILEEMAQALYREWFVKFRFPGHEKVRMVDSALGKIPDGWDVVKVGDLLEKIKRKAKIKKQDYRSEGDIPVVDQGRDFIGGFTSDLDALHDAPLPIIIFGDHTRILKYIDFPFACGADGTQLLRSDQKRMPMSLLFYVLESIDLTSFAYARHFKFLKEKEVLLPAEYVAAAFSDFADPLRDHIRAVTSKNTNLRQTRDLLLPKLISGDLDVSDMEINIPEEAA